MEWVETIGRTVEEAVETALEQLGVAEKDAEIVIVEEPRSGMFGLRRSSARIRARVRPVQPRAKRPSHRPRASSNGGERPHRRQGGRAEGASRKSEEGDGEERRAKSPSTGGRGQRGQSRQQAQDQNGTRSGRGRTTEGQNEAADSASGGPGPGGRRRSSRGRGRGGREAATANSDPSLEVTSAGGRRTGASKEAEMSIETQQQLATDFVREVVARFGIAATTSSRRSDDDGIYVSVEGENLGLLVGPKGATVEALQELTRTVVQRHTDEHTSRIVVDVGGYRERRAAALRQFVVEAAADVLRSGVPEALEPMSPSDRKIVHDTVNELEGVETTSEGVEPRRYVVIRPSAQLEAEIVTVSELPDTDDATDSSEPADLS